MSGRARVLVVDDEPAILKFLKPALEANAYEIHTVGTAAEAIRSIAADAPDIVVLDLGLPDGDGKDVIRRVREWSDVPIVVLSARDREAEKIEALDLGGGRLHQQAVRSWRAAGADACGATAPDAEAGRGAGAEGGRSGDRSRPPPGEERTATS